MTTTLEKLLTSKSGFGLTTATPLQRAICRLADGLPLGELLEQPLLQNVDAYPSDVRQRATWDWVLGDVAALPVGERPAELYLLSGIRTAKSLLAAALTVRATQSCDVSGLGPGEVPRASVLSLRIDLANVIRDHIVGRVTASRVLRQLLIGEPTTDSIMLRGAGNRAHEAKVVAGSRAGASLVARWSDGCIYDEFPRAIGSEDGVINFDHARDAVLGRLLPGAQLVGIGSPWAPFGPAYQVVQDHWQRPSRHVVVVRAPAPCMHPQHWTPGRCVELAERNATAYRTDVLGEFADPEHGLLTTDEVAACTRKAPLEIEPQRGTPRRYVAAWDAASRANAFSLAIATADRVRVAEPDGRSDEATRTRVQVVLCRQWLPRGGPLDLDAVVREIAELLERYNVRSVAADQWSSDALAALAQRYGLHVEVEHVTRDRKLALYDQLVTLCKTGCLELPPDPVVRDDLLSVRRRVTQEGVAIVLPRTSDGRHADHADSIARAVDRALACCGHDLSDQDRDWLRAANERLAAGGFWSGSEGRGFG